MTHWDTIVITVIATTPPTLTALASLIATLRNSGKTDAMARKAEAAAQKADCAVEQAVATAVKAEAIADNLQANTQLTLEAARNTQQTKEVVKRVEEQTNGVRERMEIQLQEKDKTIASLREAIGALKAEIRSLKESK